MDFIESELPALLRRTVVIPQDKNDSSWELVTDCPQAHHGAKPKITKVIYGVFGTYSIGPIPDHGLVHQIQIGLTIQSKEWSTTIWYDISMAEMVIRREENAHRVSLFCSKAFSVRQ